MKPEERLIVAADYGPGKDGGREEVLERVMELARLLKGTGVIIKVNSALRAHGYRLIDSLHDHGLRVFADLKICDIPKTMQLDGRLLEEARPEMVTAMCSAGVAGLQALDEHLTNTKVLGVTVLTSLDEEDCQAIFTCSTKAGVLRFARLAELAGISDLILSPNEVEVIESRRNELSLELNTPGIRPEWTFVEGDDQSRVMTPRKAIATGAARLVIGRPITEADDPLEAVHRTIEEIKSGISDRADS